MKENPYTPPVTKNLELIDEAQTKGWSGFLNIVIGWLTSVFSVLLWGGGIFLIMKITHKANIYDSVNNFVLWLFLCFILQFPGVIFFWFSTKYINSILASNVNFRKVLKIYCWVTGGGAIFMILILAIWAWVGSLV